MRDLEDEIKKAKEEAEEAARNAAKAAGTEEDEVGAIFCFYLSIKYFEFGISSYNYQTAFFRARPTLHAPSYQLCQPQSQQTDLLGRLA